MPLHLLDDLYFHGENGLCYLYGPYFHDGNDPCYLYGLYSHDENDPCDLFSRERDLFSHNDLFWEEA